MPLKDFARELKRVKVNLIGKRITLFPESEYDIDLLRVADEGWQIDYVRERGLVPRYGGVTYSPAVQAYKESLQKPPAPEVCAYSKPVATDYARYWAGKSTVVYPCGEVDATIAIEKRLRTAFKCDLLREAQRGLREIPFCPYGNEPVELFCSVRDYDYEREATLYRVYLICPHCEGP